MENIKTEPIEEDDTLFQESLVRSWDVDIMVTPDTTAFLAPSAVKKEASSPECEAQILVDTNSCIQNTRIFTDCNRRGLAKKVKLLCPVCNFPFSSLWHLSRHMTTHSKSKGKDYPFSCSTCGKGFSGQIGLDRHMIEHSGEVYSCPQCNKRFPTRKSFNKHIDFVHCLVKRFSCCYCSKAFAVKNFLVCHMRTHTGDKPFVCPQCNKGFSQKGALKRHLEVVCGKSRPLPLNAKELSSSDKT